MDVVEHVGSPTSIYDSKSLTHEKELGRISVKVMSEIIMTDKVSTLFHSIIFGTVNQSNFI